MRQKNRLDTAGENLLHSTSLPSEILESAHFFFQHKGFENTAIEDICNRLISTALDFITILSHWMKCLRYCGRGERMMHGLREVKNIQNKKCIDEFTVYRAVMVTIFILDFTLPIVVCRYQMMELFGKLT